MAFHSSSMLSAPFTCSLSMLDGFTWCGDFFSFALRARLSHSQVAGPSMVPTMAVTGEWVLETRWISAKKLSRGDLVTYVSPLDPSRVVCKRLIGLPGDVVCVDPTGTAAPSTEHVVIPKGHVWLAGDNAEASRDSRTYGPVSMSLIKGKLVARVSNSTYSRVFRIYSDPVVGLALQRRHNIPK